MQYQRMCDLADESESSMSNVNHHMTDLEPKQCPRPTKNINLSYTYILLDKYMYKHIYIYIRIDDYRCILIYAHHQCY